MGPSNVSFYPEMETLSKMGANWVTVMPYAFVSEKDGKVIYNHPEQWWGETTEGIAKGILAAQKQGLQVMVKPMLWIDHGTYTGALQFDAFPKWLTFEESYRDYLLHFAELSDSLGVALFCLGTEMKTFLQYRREFFPTFIEMARDSFQFELTYAANWDNYKAVPFWKELDYIGIDAYFPLSNQNQPTVEEIKKGWVAYKYELKDFAQQHQVPILFTEYGYRSKIACCKKPWISDTDEPVNETCQTNALEALHAIFFNQPWFSGGFLWKWYDGLPQFPSRMQTDYSPQGKEASLTLKTLLKP